MDEYFKQMMARIDEEFKIIRISVGVVSEKDTKRLIKEALLDYQVKVREMVKSKKHRNWDMDVQHGYKTALNDILSDPLLTKHE